jgi:transcriptional regulator GlxA family with amidase domain
VVREAGYTVLLCNNADVVVENRDEEAQATQLKQFVRSGLSPIAMRRVLEYVDTHLTERMQLAELASVAGLSVYHFAREFKRTTGVTPHSFIL